MGLKTNWTSRASLVSVCALSLTGCMTAGLEPGVATQTGNHASLASSSQHGKDANIVMVGGYNQGGGAQKSEANFYTGDSSKATTQNASGGWFANRSANYYSTSANYPVSAKQGSGFSVKNMFASRSNDSISRNARYTGLSEAGVASWYGSDFHNGPTASGERYDMWSLTCAHRYLPFGTLVKVENLNNGQECVVRVNNRGPFLRDRMLDLSKGATRELGMIGSGIAQVRMTVIGSLSGRDVADQGQ